MDYIVLDLEWNQCPGGKERENPNLPFEIIEIGAVRLDADFQIVNTFSERIRPQVYHQLHFRTKQLLKVNLKEFNKARKFTSVMKDFLRWCGKDYTFATWGPMDLDYLQNNMDFYKMQQSFDRPLFYYDVQKLFSLFYEDGKSRKSLKYAADFLKLEQERPFHCAIDDAGYTAQILARMEPKQAAVYCSVDYHYPPTQRSEEIYLHFPQYSKFVSMIYDNKEDIMNDRMVTVTPCHICGRSLRKKIRWFTSNNSVYYSLSLCKEHGYMQGKIRIKKADSGHYFAIRTTKMISEETAGSLREKQETLRMKRRIRRSRSASATAYTAPAGTVNISVSPTAADKRKNKRNL
ncbi:MAG: 3'-5' exonuclease [Lachnospiraceae bacterium]|nr:3'-5' exonuclease [Lachnospiraceae bacterium]